MSRSKTLEVRRLPVDGNEVTSQDREHCNFVLLRALEVRGKVDGDRFTSSPCDSLSGCQAVNLWLKVSNIHKYNRLSFGTEWHFHQVDRFTSMAQGAVRNVNL